MRSHNYACTRNPTPRTPSRIEATYWQNRTHGHSSVPNLLSRTSWLLGGDLHCVAVYARTWWCYRLESYQVNA
jgi:hypothetical protein